MQTSLNSGSALYARFDLNLATSSNLANPTGGRVLVLGITDRKTLGSLDKFAAKSSHSLFSDKKKMMGRGSKKTSFTMDIFDDNTDIPGPNQGPSETREQFILADGTPNASRATTLQLMQSVPGITELNKKTKSDTIEDRLHQKTDNQAMGDVSIALRSKMDLTIKDAHLGNSRQSNKGLGNDQQGRIQSSYQSISVSCQTVSAVTRRAPLKATTRAVQVRATVLDIPGKGPGKENIPPGMGVNGTEKKGGKPKSAFEEGQAISGIGSELRGVVKNKSVTPKINKPKMLGKQLSEQVTGKTVKPKQTKKMEHEPATERVMTGSESVKKELGLGLPDEKAVLDRSVVSSGSQSPSKPGAEDVGGNRTVGRNELSSTEVHEHSQGECREVAVIKHHHMSVQPTLTVYIKHIKNSNQKSDVDYSEGHQEVRLFILKGLQTLMPFELSPMLKQFFLALLRFKGDVELQRALSSLWFKGHLYPALAAYLEASLARLLYGRGGKYILGGNGEGLEKVAKKM